MSVRTIAALSLSASLLLAGIAWTEEMPVAANQQGEVFKKVFSFDRTLADREDVELLVVYEGTPSGLIGDIVLSFQEAGIASSTVSEDDLPGLINQASVVYFAPGVDVDAFNALCIENQVLTISGDPSLAEDGHVAIGVDVRDDRPEIVVHMGRLKAEGHVLSSELLRLSRIIR